MGWKTELDNHSKYDFINVVHKLSSA